MHLLDCDLRVIIIVTVLVMSDDRRDAKFVLLCSMPVLQGGRVDGLGSLASFKQLVSLALPPIPVKVLTREGTFDRLLPCARKVQMLRKKSSRHGTFSCSSRNHWDHLLDSHPLRSPRCEPYSQRGQRPIDWISLQR